MPLERSFLKSCLCAPVSKQLYTLKKELCNLSLTFTKAAKPEAGSGWPILDLVEPMSRGFCLVWQNTVTIPFTSCGSPTCTYKLIFHSLVSFIQQQPNDWHSQKLIIWGDMVGHMCVCEPLVYPSALPLSLCHELRCTPPAQGRCWLLDTVGPPAFAASHQKGMSRLTNERLTGWMG